MDNCRESEGGGDLELSPKCAFLFRGTWASSRKIEPGFSNGNGVETLDRSLQLSNERALVLVRKLRVQTESEIDVRMTVPQQS